MGQGQGFREQKSFKSYHLYHLCNPEKKTHNLSGPQVLWLYNEHKGDIPAYVMGMWPDPGKLGAWVMGSIHHEMYPGTLVSLLA